MECSRFKKLLKSWYLQVQEEALAPARMVDFMEQHIASCPVCMMDPESKKDMAKIITLVLPQDKLKNVQRSSKRSEDDFEGSGISSSTCKDQEDSDGEDIFAADSCDDDKEELEEIEDDEEDDL